MARLCKYPDKECENRYYSNAVNKYKCRLDEIQTKLEDMKKNG